MKKRSCLMMAIVMMILCMVGFAQGAEMAPFVQTLTAAQVYKEAGGSEGTDTLAAGSVCGLIETVAAGGNDWFHVLYLNSAKKGAEGYLQAKDAKQLTEDELTALLEDTEKANEMLDLINALDEYVKAGTESTAVGSADTADTGTQNEGKKKGLLGSLYDKAVEKLSQGLSIDASTGLSELASASKEVVGNMTKAGKELLEGAGKTGKDLLDNVGKKLSGLAKDATKTGKDLADSIKNSEQVKKGTDILKKAEKIGEQIIVDSVNKKLDSIDKKLDDFSKKNADGSGKTETDNTAKTETESSEKKGNAISNLVKKVTETVETVKKISKNEGLQKKLDDAKKQIDKTLGEKTGKKINDVIRTVDLVKGVMNSDKFELGRSFAAGVGNVFTESGFSQGLQMIKTLAAGFLKIAAAGTGK